MKNILLTTLLSLSLASTALAQAVSGADAQKEVKATIDEVKSIVSENNGKLSEAALDEKIESVLLPKFDFDQMSKSSLGSGWKKASPEQQVEFVKLFTTLLAHSYLEKIRKNIEKSEVTFSPTTVKEDRVIVHCRVLADGQSIAIDYRIYLKDGKYKVYDVLVENIGLVSNYRSEFSGLLDSGDFESLLKKLREQVSKGRK
jgi:phospholipid transport system substrate-binding protein